jgi:hypothetical protein
VVKVSGVTAIFVALFQPYWITPSIEIGNYRWGTTNLDIIAYANEWA